MEEVLNMMIKAEALTTYVVLDIKAKPSQNIVDTFTKPCVEVLCLSIYLYCEDFQFMQRNVILHVRCK